MFYSILFLTVALIGFYMLASIGTVEKSRRVLAVVVSAIAFAVAISSVPDTAGLSATGEAWVTFLKEGWIGLITFVSDLFSSTTP